MSVTACQNVKSAFTPNGLENPQHLKTWMNASCCCTCGSTSHAHMSSSPPSSSSSGGEEAALRFLLFLMQNGCVSAMALAMLAAILFLDRPLFLASAEPYWSRGSAAGGALEILKSLLGLGRMLSELILSRSSRRRWVVAFLSAVLAAKLCICFFQSHNSTIFGVHVLTKRAFCRWSHACSDCRMLRACVSLLAFGIGPRIHERTTLPKD